LCVGQLTGPGWGPYRHTLTGHGMDVEMGADARGSARTAAEMMTPDELGCA
jgi:hypothetical protein